MSVRRGLPDVVAQQFEPVRLVASLGVGESEQDFPLLALAAFRELAVDLRLGTFVGEILPPLADRACGAAQPANSRVQCAMRPRAARR